MQILLALWHVSLALAAVSLLGMVTLLIGRPIRAWREQQIKGSRSAILQILIGQPPSVRSLRKHVARAARLRALAPIVMEVLAVIRGSARSAFVAQLTSAGAGRALRVSVQYGKPQDRQRAVEALAAFSPLESEQALQNAWWDSNPVVRLTAMRASIDAGAPPAFVDVLQLANTAGPADQSLALRVLWSIARLQPNAAREAITGAYLRPATRAVLIEALPVELEPSTIEILLVAMADKSPVVRAAGVGALGLRPAPAGVAAIVSAFNDRSWTVRAAAAEAAARASLVALEPCLKLLLCDAHWWVRLRAADALEVLGSRRQQSEVA